MIETKPEYVAQCSNWSTMLKQGPDAFDVERKAEAISIYRREKFTIVAAKIIPITAFTRDLKKLVSSNRHLKVINLVGACIKNVSYGELFVIVEFCRFGNLRDTVLSLQRADLPITMSSTSASAFR